MNIRILIVDDHEIVRAGVRRLIEQSGHNDWQVCGEAANGRQALEAVKTLNPDVAVMDISMPSMNGLDAARHIAENGFPCRTLLFTMHDPERLTEKARRAGARGLISKSDAARYLIVAMERLLAGGTFFGNPEETPVLEAPTTGDEQKRAA